MIRYQSYTRRFVSFKKSFEKVASIPGLGVVGKGLRAAGKAGVSLAGGKLSAGLGLLGIAGQAASDASDFSSKMRQAQMR